MIKIYSKKTDGNTKLSENFKVSEFACQDGTDVVIVDEELVTILQILRNYFGKPVNINSGYRTIVHNSKVGGVGESQHTTGRAADIYVDGVKPAEVAAFLAKICGNSYGIGRYSNFVHIDTRKVKSRWNG